MMTRIQTQLFSARGLALPLAICAGAFAALPFLSGLPTPSGSRAPAAAPAAAGGQRIVQEVHVPNAARGCRWQPSSDPAIQIADCGDDAESVRVVFKDGRATEYRLIARQDPSTPPSAQAVQMSAPPQSGVAGIVSVQQPSQPGRSVPSSGSVPNSGAPLRVTVTAGS